MATRKKSDAPKPAAARKLTRNYIVVKVEQGGQLTVLDPERAGKNQQDAMDAVNANMAPDQRNVVLGAFLAGSYREQEYTAEQKLVTSSKPRTPQFTGPGSPEPQQV